MSNGETEPQAPKSLDEVLPTEGLDARRLADPDLAETEARELVRLQEHPEEVQGLNTPESLAASAVNGGIEDDQYISRSPNWVSRPKEERKYDFNWAELDQRRKKMASTDLDPQIVAERQAGIEKSQEEAEIGKLVKQYFPDIFDMSDESKAKARAGIRELYEQQKEAKKAATAEEEARKKAEEQSRIDDILGKLKSGELPLEINTSSAPETATEDEATLNSESPAPETVHNSTDPSNIGLSLGGEDSMH